MKSETVIIGTSLACLVAAYEIAKRGEQVTLVSNGGRWGGHFAGVDTCGVHYDAGMAIVELTSRLEEKKPALEDYNIYRRNDVGRYVHTIEEYLSEIVPLNVIDTPQSFYRNSWNDDFLLCNKFQVFSRWTDAEKKMVINDLKDRSSSDWRHASHKIEEQHLHECATYNEVSNYNHGGHIHRELIEPFVNKLTNLTSKEVSSIYHRRLWSPLYYPETLAKAVAGEMSEIGSTVIHYPKHGSFATFAKVCLEGMEQYDNASVIHDKVARIDTEKKRVYLANGDELDYQNLSWGGKMFEAFNIFDVNMIQDYATKRANLTFAFVVLDRSQLKKDCSITFVLDPNIHAYRVTNVSNCASEDSDQVRVLIEFNTDTLTRRGIIPAQYRQLSVETLIQMGIIESPEAVKDIDVKSIPNLLPIANLHYNEVTKMNAQQLQKSVKDLVLMGDSSGMSTRSFADNVVQGLKYAEFRA